MNDKQTFQWDEMTMGTCYYPEHWDKRIWQSDLERMLETGISVIRIAEFAWNKFEPNEGEFTFEFFDEFLELCQKQGMKVILGTPTATPPAWLTSKYPEVLNRRINGTVMEHGARRHYNYNSPIYQELCARIVTKMGEHYGQHPAIIGWQIDNEINCEVNVFYSTADTMAFRIFLQEKYANLDALNKAWGTTFWNQTYTDWEQIFVPRHTPSGNVNPHLELDYYRFISASAIAYCRLQSDILRKYVREDVFITTNGMFSNLDNHKMEKECLDIYTYDSYPSFAYGIDNDLNQASGLGDRQWSRNLNEVRSICPHFGIMEQQSGANGWNVRMEGPAPRPGQLKLWSMQSLAHGADFISFFRWRTCTMGTEIYWHGILDYDSRDTRRLAEVKEFHAWQKKLNVICGAEYEASFAVLKDYDNEWDCTVDSWHRRVSYPSEQGIFEASELNHTPYDLVYLQEDSKLSDLTKYPVLIYPHPSIINAARTALLKAYTEQGGTLILGCRSGYKNLTGQCVQMPQPGLLAELTGTDVTEWSFTSPAEPPMFGNFAGEQMEAPIFNDIMKVDEGVEVLASYEGSFYKGTPMLTKRILGKGKVLHLGTTFGRNNTTQILKYLDILEPYSDFVDIPEDIELSVRAKSGRKWMFLLNYMNKAQTMTVKKPMICMESGKTVSGTISLDPFGIAVLAMQ